MRCIRKEFHFTASMTSRREEERKGAEFLQRLQAIQGLGNKETIIHTHQTKCEFHKILIVYLF